MILFFFTLENDGNVAAMLDFIRNAMAKVIFLPNHYVDQT